MFRTFRPVFDGSAAQSTVTCLLLYIYFCLFACKHNLVVQIFCLPTVAFVWLVSAACIACNKNRHNKLCFFELPQSFTGLQKLAGCGCQP